MDTSACGADLVSVDSVVMPVLQRAGWPEDIAEYVRLYELLAAKMRRQNLQYLPLPAAIAEIEAHPAYQHALCWGRGAYFDDLHEVDEAGNVVRVPDLFTRADILGQVRMYLTCGYDLQLSAVTPLPLRVGLAVGWLSGLAVSQREDAEAGLALVAVLVAPLLLRQAGDQSKTKQLETKTSRAVARSRSRTPQT